MAVWGYTRVSSREQNEERQIVEIKPYVTTESHLIIDKISGKDFNRPKYQSMKNLMNSGDTLVILSLDRLGRNYEMIKTEWQYFKDNGIHIRVLDMPLLNTDKSDDLTMKLISDVVLELLSYVAESERRNIKSRQAQGIKVAKEKGVKFGRPKLQCPSNWETVISKWQCGEIKSTEAIRLLNIPRSSFYKLVSEQGITRV